MARISLARHKPARSYLVFGAGKASWRPNNLIRRRGKVVSVPLQIIPSGGKVTGGKRNINRRRIRVKPRTVHPKVTELFLELRISDCEFGWFKVEQNGETPRENRTLPRVAGNSFSDARVGPGETAEPNARRAFNIQSGRGAHDCRASRPPERASGPFHPDHPTLLATFNLMAAPKLMADEGGQRHRHSRPLASIRGSTPAQSGAAHSRCSPKAASILRGPSPPSLRSTSSRRRIRSRMLLRG